ncbi:MAG: molybdopterin-dependent oxidoreductase [Candidatus Cloacimonetes bacterium]|nr:molybdopterin-dependent oxidoreductase [Candidatus Cloacimonadota bacterium]
MKRLTFLIILLGIFSSLMALTLKTSEQSNNLDVEALYMAVPSELVTEKEKDGEIFTRTWKGVKLTDLLKKYNLADYDLVKFSSDDNYLVRLTKAEISSHESLIALYLNGEKLEGNRLIIPDMPGMYWISNISLIETEAQANLDLPSMFQFAEGYLDDFKLIQNPEPFVDVEGYYLPQLLQMVMPSMQGQYQLIGRDGISHLLDYNDYLAKAVLVKSESGYILQSPQMPGGMWIKDIAYIQKGDIAIIFRAQFSSWEEVKTLTGWWTVPKEFRAIDF